MCRHHRGAFVFHVRALASPKDGEVFVWFGGCVSREEEVLCRGRANRKSIRCVVKDVKQKLHFR